MPLFAAEDRDHLLRLALVLAHRLMAPDLDRPLAGKRMFP
jgi:hypothetical protein